MSTPTPKTASPTTEDVADSVLKYDPAEFVDPCGREWAVRVNEWHPGMVEVFCTKPRVKTPEILGGLWTGRAKAEKALFNFIAREWEKVASKRGTSRR